MGDTLYATCGDLSIAYQLVGEGPVDLVFAGSFVSAIGILAITATGPWSRLKRQMEHRAFHN